MEMRKCGREVSHHDLTRTNSEDAMRVGVVREGEDTDDASLGIISKIMKPPLKIVEVSCNGYVSRSTVQTVSKLLMMFDCSLTWILQSCYIRELIPERLSTQWPLSKVLVADKPIFSWLVIQYIEIPL